MKNIIIKTVIIVTIVTIACVNRSGSDQKNLNQVLASYVQDTIIRDIPKTVQGKLGSEYYSSRELESYLGIENIENGFDSIEIRIWYAFSDTSQLVRIRNHGGKWNGDLFNFHIYKIRREDTIFHTTKQIIALKPFKGWEKLIQEIIDLQIISLPDAQKIKNYSFMTDGGNNITVEIAAKNLYRLYSYPSPVFNKNKKEVRNMFRILEIIENEFQFKRKLN